MGRYSILAIFEKEPAFIAGVIRAVLMAAVLFGLAIDEKQLAGISLALELILTLFVRSNSTGNANVPPSNTVVTTATTEVSTTTTGEPAPDAGKG